MIVIIHTKRFLPSNSQISLVFPTSCSFTEWKKSDFRGHQFGVQKPQQKPVSPQRASPVVYGYAVDASPTPEWLVITDGQQSGRWRLPHNSTSPGQRCSVGCSQRYQLTPNTAEQRKAQDYTFEALRRVYFHDAWRAQPVLNAPGSEVFPPQPGLLVHGCFWPQPSAPKDVLSVSNVATEADDQSYQTPTSPETAADAIMADEKASNIVSVLSSPSEPFTLPSAVLQEEADSPMEDKDGDATSSDEEGDLAIAQPSPTHDQQTKKMLDENGEESSALPPHGVDPQDQSFPSHFSESPIKRRPGTKASAGRAQSKKLRQSVGQAPSHLAAFLNMGNSRSRLRTSLT